jgi:2-polyprenyl-3-methyl-5-hydroxy-6-metoxy-1,4-benzoquinol methylase
MLFIEVAEHMTDKELTVLFKKIKPNYILFSSTPNVTDSDNDWGHINIKPKEEWLTFFEKKGYVLEKFVTLPTEWSIILKKK